MTVKFASGFGSVTRTRKSSSFGAWAPNFQKSMTSGPGSHSRNPNQTYQLGSSERRVHFHVPGAIRDIAETTRKRPHSFAHTVSRTCRTFGNGVLNAWEGIIYGAPIEKSWVRPPAWGGGLFQNVPRGRLCIFGGGGGGGGPPIPKVRTFLACLVIDRG